MNNNQNNHNKAKEIHRSSWRTIGTIKAEPIEIGDVPDAIFIQSFIHSDR